MKKVKDNCFIDLENGLFIKYFSRDNFSNAGIRFQRYLASQNLKSVSIAEIVEVNELEGSIEVSYKLYDAPELEINESSVMKVAKSMAEIHNLVWEKSPDIDSKLKQYDFKQPFKSEYFDGKELELRNITLSKITTPTDLNYLLCHRDFRAKNILQKKDDELILIDFDFTAVDLVAIEIGGFLTDVLEISDKSLVNLFIDTYMKFAKYTKQDAKYALEVYLKYLSISEFPYKNKHKYTSARFKELVSDRKYRISLLRDYFEING